MKVVVETMRRSPHPTARLGNAGRVVLLYRVLLSYSFDRESPHRTARDSERHLLYVFEINSETRLKLATLVGRFSFTEFYRVFHLVILSQWQLFWKL